MWPSMMKYQATISYYSKATYQILPLASFEVIASNREEALARAWELYKGPKTLAGQPVSLEISIIMSETVRNNITKYYGRDAPEVLSKLRYDSVKDKYYWIDRHGAIISFDW